MMPRAFVRYFYRRLRLRAALAAQENNVSFIGRLGAYRYYNMDQVVSLALDEFERIKAKLESGG